RLQFWLIVIGFNLTFFPQHYLGAIGMPRRIYTYGPGRGWDFWNLMSTIGAFGIALSVLLFLLNAVRSVRRGAGAPGAAWGGRPRGVADVVAPAGAQLRCDPARVRT